jgi:CBS domain-containing protein
MASFVSRKLSPESIYTERLRRKGVHAHHGQDVNILRAIPVAHALRHEENTIADTASFDALVRLALETRRNVIFTVDDAGRFTGVVVLQDLKYVLNDPEELTHAYDIVDFKQEIAPISVTQFLDTVVNRFAETGLDCLPVVDAEGKLVGAITMEDIVSHYNRELADRSIAVELGAHIAAHDRCCLLPIGTDTAVAEIDVPRWMVGKKLAELELRLRYNVSVFIVRETGNPGSHFFTPGADYIFRPGDTLLVAGANKAIRSLQNGGS